MTDDSRRRNYVATLTKTKAAETQENQDNAILRQNDRISRILDSLRDLNARLKTLEAQITCMTRKAP